MVVPKDQAEMIYNSVKERGGDVEYKLYAGEGHGWRQEQSMRDLNGNSDSMNVCLN
jgi:dipeptidyl aminopeptidase/acylaminoacyl peptidase